MDQRLRQLAADLRLLADAKPESMLDAFALLMARDHRDHPVEGLDPLLQISCRATDSVNFGLMLRNFLGGQVEGWRARPTKVLSLGCGLLREGLSVMAFMTGAELGQLSDQTEIFGVDISRREIQRAQERYQLVQVTADSKLERRPVPGFTLIHGNGEKLNQIPAIPAQVDLAYLRHQNFSNPRANWGKIFSAAYNRLAPEGRLLATSFFLEEHQRAVRCLRELGAVVELEGRNQHSTQRRVADERLGVNEMWTDGWIVVAKRA